MCVTANAAAPITDQVNEWSKSTGQTTISNFQLFLEHWYAPVPFTSLTSTHTLVFIKEQYAMRMCPFTSTSDQV